jgi:hypothetical protein
MHLLASTPRPKPPNQPQRGNKTNSTYEKIVTLFDTAEHAEATRQNLLHAGFAGSEISITGNDQIPTSAATLREPGFWQKIFGNDVAQHEATVYAKAVETGGVVLTLRAESDEVPVPWGF